MSRVSLNFILDAVLLIILSALLWTTVLLQAAFPAPTQADGWILWGLDYDDWAFGQFILVAGLSAGVLLHLMLHWNWVCSFVGTRWARFRRRTYEKKIALHTVYGVTLLIVILTIGGLILLTAEFTIVPPPAPIPLAG